MIRLSANLTMLFTELPLLDRFDAAAAAGFKAVECVDPFSETAEAIAERLDRNDLEFALFNMPPGDWGKGDRGYAADPDRVVEFARSIETTRAYALATGCRTVHLMAGKVPTGANRPVWRKTLENNIRLAADSLIRDGLTLVLEPINSRVDIPGYYYDTSRAALDIIAAVDRPNVKLLYDVYHMQIMEGDLARTIEQYLPQIGHIQIADNPGRHEPGTGEIAYPWLLERLDTLGYGGWIGCEYQPSGDTIDSFAWAEPYLMTPGPHQN
jgi:hydroxypyruvate isomerase